jgi:exopolysaccharide biosynthesis polyprenyl glycosylphosphotransferase
MDGAEKTLQNKDQKSFSISLLERRWLLYLSDAAALNAGFVLSFLFREDYVLSWELLGRNPHWFVLLNLVWFVIGSLFQVYDLEQAGRGPSAFGPIVSAGLAALLLFNLIPYLPPKLPPSRQPLFITLLLPVLLLVVGRALYLFIFGHSRFRRRVLIIGAGWAGETVFQALEEHGRALYQVIGFVDDDPQKQDGEVLITLSEDGQLSSAPVLGSTEELIKIAGLRQVDTVVLAITSDISGELYQVLTRCLQRELEILPMPVLYEQLTGKVPVQHIGDHWSVAMPLDHPGTKLVWHAAKRLFDLFWAGLGLVFLAVLFPFLALVIYIDSPGPIFYRQKRLGRNEKVFWVYKFRSMIPDAEQGKAVWAEEEDPRVTRVGKLLRKTHLDEFPQFLNILKGEMSVVGPRPERPEFIEELAEEIPFYRVRLAVKPGMAGWGLIHQGYGASVEDALEKLQYDLYYIKHQSLGLDMYILFRTFWDTISFGGR